MILPLLISPIALNFVQAKHFLVETEDNKDEDNKDKDNKANAIHIHISNNSTFPFISLHFSLSLLLSIERQKQHKYINKAIQKVQSSSYIFVIHPDKFEIL